MKFSRAAGVIAATTIAPDTATIAVMIRIAIGK
jgi:hypothetical protein